MCIARAWPSAELLRSRSVRLEQVDTMSLQASASSCRLDPVPMHCPSVLNAGRTRSVTLLLRMRADELRRAACAPIKAAILLLQVVQQQTPRHGLACQSPPHAHQPWPRTRPLLLMATAPLPTRDSSWKLT